MQGEGQAPGAQEHGQIPHRGPGLMSLDGEDGQVRSSRLASSPGFDLHRHGNSLGGVQHQSPAVQELGPLRPVIHQPNILTGEGKFGGQQTSQGPGADNGHLHESGSRTWLFIIVRKNMAGRLNVGK